jgi:hypothetical protein
MSYGYRLEEDTEIEGYLIPAGFDWDGATIPRLFWSIIGGPFHPQVMRASLLHDWLYWTRKIPRKQADKLLRKLLLEDGCTAFKAESMYRAVRMFGGMYFKRTEIDTKYAQILCQHLESKGRDPELYQLPELFDL